MRYQTASERARRGAELDGALDGEEQAALETAADALATTERALRSFPARPISPYEPVELLERALDECERLLIVTSRDLVRSKSDGRLAKQIEAVLQRGARVVVALADAPDPTGSVLELERLSGRYGRLELVSGESPEFTISSATRRSHSCATAPSWETTARFGPSSTSQAT